MKWGRVGSWVGCTRGLIDLIPTIMIGTILPSASSSPFGLSEDDCPSDWALPLRGLKADPNLNILKKLRGAGISPPDSSSPSLPACLKADAILPLERAWRKLSNVPSSPSPIMLMFRASETAAASPPIKESAVCSAAYESNRERRTTWSSCSSPRLRGDLDLRRRSESVMLLIPRSERSAGSSKEDLRSRQEESRRNLFPAVGGEGRSSKSRSRVGGWNRGRKGLLP